MELRTERLLLRDWQDGDLAPFAAMNADRAVMEHFPDVLSREDSDRTAERIRSHIRERGFGMWAVEVVGEAPFIGFVGLMNPRFVAHFTPCVEVGWRLAHAYWNRGYATEGARAALRAGFEGLGLEEIVAITVAKNVRSIHVMEKLKMTRDPKDDFDHPLVPPTSPARRHILYRLRMEAWRTTTMR
jgi:RimJ/RimL family protein N-acetyltransferase